MELKKPTHKMRLFVELEVEYCETGNGIENNICVDIEKIESSEYKIHYTNVTDRWAGWDDEW